MKLISLNTWGGRAGLDNLLAFLKDHEDTDIFCLQEAWSGGEHMVGKIAGGVPLHGIVPQLIQEIETVLPGHRVFFRPHFYDFYGLALFIKKDISVIEEGELFVYKERGYASIHDLGDHARNVQHATIETPSGLRTILNFHGLWNGKGKNDTEDRLLQSDNIINFIKHIPHPYVLAGDFNLLPETESILKLESSGLKNLIKENNITSTRTSLYKKPVRFADYVFVSKEIRVADFNVLPEEVSDHSALYLEFT